MLRPLKAESKPRTLFALMLDPADVLPEEFIQEPSSEEIGDADEKLEFVSEPDDDFVCLGVKIHEAAFDLLAALYCSIREDCDGLPFEMRQAADRRKRFGGVVPYGAVEIPGSGFAHLLDDVFFSAFDGQIQFVAVAVRDHGDAYDFALRIVPVPADDLLLSLVGKAGELAVGENAPEQRIGDALQRARHDTGFGDVVGEDRHIGAGISVLLPRIHEFAHLARAALDEEHGVADDKRLRLGGAVDRLPFHAEVGRGERRVAVAGGKRPLRIDGADDERVVLAHPENGVHGVAREREVERVVVLVADEEVIPRSGL